MDTRQTDRLASAPPERVVLAIPPLHKPAKGFVSMTGSSCKSNLRRNRSSRSLTNLKHIPWRCVRLIEVLSAYVQMCAHMVNTDLEIERNSYQ